MRTLARTLTILVAIAVAGCGGGSGPRAADQGPAASSTNTQPDAPTATADGQGTPDDRTPTPRVAGVTTRNVRAAVLPLGTLPADGFTLPLASPDGRFLATHVGAAPQWSTALAEIDAPLPDATTIEVYELLPEERRIAMRREIGTGLLLGRGVDAEGFLVEQPRSDGTRRIGKASWSNGSIRWLVDDDAVNAFAAPGPDGRLAWSRRTLDAERFELAVREPDGRVWTVGGDGRDWLMPSWSGRDDGLFALLLEDGRLDLVHLVARGASAADQSLRREPLTSSGSVYVAYQTTIGQPALVDPSAPSESIAFYHPRQHRAAIWRPHAADRRLLLMPRGTITAVVDRAGYALTPTDSDLLLVDPGDRDDVKPLLKGLLIPRPTPGAPYPYLLLTPRERAVGITAMDLLE